MALGSAHEGYLLRAIELARRSRENGNHPFGSLLVDASGRVVLEAENTVVTGRDVTGHAEFNLVHAASMQFDAAVLQGATLYASTEPCAMCSGGSEAQAIAISVSSRSSRARTSGSACNGLALDRKNETSPTLPAEATTAPSCTATACT